MDLEQKIAIAKRNTEEIVTEEELRNLLETNEKPRAYVGYEPSGEIHLGHMITVQKLVDLQDVGFEIVVLLADLHAYLNEKGTFEEIEEIAKMNRKVFEALGLNAKFVLGSEFQLKENYMLDVLKFARITTLNRAKRSMDEVSRRKDDPMVSQMIYPLMQSLDIAYLNVDVAVGGIDQRKIHMLARENLPKLGYKAPVCIHTPILLGLDGQKMSSSKGNFISVRDPPKAVEEKMRKAFCPAKVVENNPVLEIIKFYIFPRFKEFAVEFKGTLNFNSFEELKLEYEKGNVHPLDLKIAAANYLNKILDPVREKLRCQSE